AVAVLADAEAGAMQALLRGLVQLRPVAAAQQRDGLQCEIEPWLRVQSPARGMDGLGGVWPAQGAGADRQHVAGLQRAARLVAEPRMQVAAAAAQHRW